MKIAVKHVLHFHTTYFLYFCSLPCLELCGTLDFWRQNLEVAASEITKLKKKLSING